MAFKETLLSKNSLILKINVNCFTFMRVPPPPHQAKKLNFRVYIFEMFAGFLDHIVSPEDTSKIIVLLLMSLS